MRTLHYRALLVPLLLSTGCGGNLASVSGTVSLNGKPIEEGSINFIPIDGTTGAGSGAVITKGKYYIAAARGVAVGRNRIELRAFINTGRQVVDPTAQPGTMTAERVPAFPPEYNDKSTLVKEVHWGSNTINFDITLPSP
jgi:hypothetical protein